MATLSSPHMQNLHLSNNRTYRKIHDFYYNNQVTRKDVLIVKNSRMSRRSSGRGTSCLAITIDASPSKLSSEARSIRWGCTKVQGAREEMEDDVVIVNNSKGDAEDDRSGSSFGRFSYAAVFDGHAGFSSVQFLREELHNECAAALQGGLLLDSKDFTDIRKALEKAFEAADSKLLSWLETNGEDIESGSTATVMFLRNDKLFVSHVGDSSLVLSRSGKPEMLTNSHRPYGTNKVSLQEIKRIKEAGGWIVDGRICGDISVSRAFGDMRFKTKKNEMLKKGVEEGIWTEKFASRVKFSGDLVSSTPDILQESLGPDVEFVLLASDGLWDYISSSQAVKFVRNQLREHGDVQMASDALARLALDRQSQDNISIVIADLGRTDWQSLPSVQQQNFAIELAQAVATMGVVSLGIWMTSLLS